MEGNKANFCLLAAIHKLLPLSLRDSNTQFPGFRGAGEIQTGNQSVLCSMGEYTGLRMVWKCPGKTDRQAFLFQLFANHRSVLILFWPSLNSRVSHLQEDRGLIQKLASERQKLAGILLPTFGSCCHRWHVIKLEPGYFLAAVA